MSKNVLYIIGGLLLLCALFFVPAYNSLVKKDEKVKQQWSEVQNAYQRRLDLVPNLVNTVKGGADFESTTLEQIAAARAKAQSVSVTTNADPATFARQTAAQNELAGATNRLLIQVENYPQLRGTQAFKDLQVQLEGTERRIKFARKDFNEAVADYNQSARSFPTSLVASVTGFKSRNGFTADAGAEKTVDIKF